MSKNKMRNKKIKAWGCIERYSDGDKLIKFSDEMEGIFAISDKKKNAKCLMLSYNPKIIPVEIKLLSLNKK